MAEITLKLRAGTITRQELDQVARHFFPMARNIAKHFHRGDDELVSAGYLGIAYALAEAPNKMYDNDLEKWVKSCVYSFIRRQRATNHLVPIPDATIRRHEKQGSRTIFMRRYPIGENNAITKSDKKYHDLLASIEDEALDEDDVKIIHLRVDGYTDAEIAEKLNKCTAFVHCRRVKLETRFKENN